MTYRVPSSSSSSFSSSFSSPSITPRNENMDLGLNAAQWGQSTLSPHVPSNIVPSSMTFSAPPPSKALLELLSLLPTSGKWDQTTCDRVLLFFKQNPEAFSTASVPVFGSFSNRTRDAFMALGQVLQSNPVMDLKTQNLIAEQIAGNFPEKAAFRGRNALTALLQTQVPSATFAKILDLCPDKAHLETLFNTTDAGGALPMVLALQNKPLVFDFSSLKFCSSEDKKALYKTLKHELSSWANNKQNMPSVNHSFLDKLEGQAHKKRPSPRITPKQIEDKAITLIEAHATDNPELFEKNPELKTQLMKALIPSQEKITARQYTLEILDLCFQHGADANLKDAQGVKLLAVVARQHSATLREFVLDRICEQKPSALCQEAALLATQTGNIKHVQPLIKALPDDLLKEQIRPLVENLVNSGNVESIGWFLAHAEKKNVDFSREQALYHALLMSIPKTEKEQNHRQIFEILVAYYEKSKTPLSTQDIRDLLLAIVRSEKDVCVIKTFLELAKNKTESFPKSFVETLLSKAIIFGDHKTITVFLDHAGTNPTIHISEKLFKKSLTQAASHGNIHSLTCLFQYAHKSTAVSVTPEIIQEILIEMMLHHHDVTAFVALLDLIQNTSGHALTADLLITSLLVRPIFDLPIDEDLIIAVLKYAQESSIPVTGEEISLRLLNRYGTYCEKIEEIMAIFLPHMNEEQ